MRALSGARLWAGLAVAVAALLAPAASFAADPPSIVVTDGVTQPVFDYSTAIRERLWITADFDSDSNGVLDEVAMDIMRPAANADGLKSPVIMDASPYYTTLCRGNDSECIGDTDGDGLNDRWPLYYDNYFVPRGYAMMLLHMAGTGASTGCPVTGGTPDNRSAVLAIDWLQGRRTAHDKNGAVVTADWDNGKAGMIGKSYDGTLANAAAATGVDGLTTIVPISAISNWYLYTRMNGLGLSGFTNNYPSSLSNTVTNPDRRAGCAATRTVLNGTDGDENFDFTPFWFERDYLHNLESVHASVLAAHGMQDDNVKMNNLGKWWDGLAARNVPRKLWLGRVGHVDPFDFRRGVWVDTLHRWFDYWLQGVPNGIMGEPMATIERGPDVFEDYSDWPSTTTSMRKIYLRGTASGAGGLSQSQADAVATTTFTDTTNQSETAMLNNPNTVTNTKRVFLSAPLTAPLRFNGTPYMNLKASANQTGTSLGALIVDYAPTAFQKVTRNGEGISTVAATDCWGPSVPTDFDSCYRIVNKATTNVTQWRVSRGILDSRNRDDLTTPTPLVAGQLYNFRWDLMPDDYVFLPGHQIGIILVGTLNGFAVANQNFGAQITIDLKDSNIELPIEGGYAASLAAGIPDTVAPTLSVPADITTPATGASTPVSFNATATDDADPNPAVSCTPASGSGFAVGTTTVTCTATDGAGNSSSGSFTVTITDAVAPASNAVLSGTQNLGWWRNPTVTITATDNASGVQKIEYRLDGGAWQTYAGAFQVTGDGARLLEYRATDNAGNVEATKSLSFKVDGTAPTTTVSLSPPSVGGFYKSPMVTLNASDGAGIGVAAVQYTLDGSGTRSYTGPFPVPMDGSHTVTFRAVDMTGLIETTQTFSFTNDGTAPSSKATLSPAAVNGYYSGPTTVTLSANDFAGGSGIASIEYLLDGGGWTAYTAPLVVSGDGSHTIQFHATDNAGNVEGVKTKSFTIDATGPVISITTPSQGENIALNSSVTPVYSCIDTASGVSSCSGPATVTTGPIGSHSYSVTATDNAGNTTTLTHTYNVVWPFTWVSAPSSEKAGKSVAVKFRLGGNYGLGVLNGTPTSQQVNCTTGAAIGSSSNASGSLSYSSSTYSYSWSSSSSWRNTCRTLTLRLDDGTSHSLTVRFT